MRSRVALAVSLSLFVSLAAPAWAGTLSFFEDSLGSPGVTAQFAPGSGLLADIDYDASSAEGGSMPFGGPSEILILPVGDAVLTAFTCQLAAGCGVYTFTPGGAGTGSLLISDEDSDAQSGLYELGDLTWDSFGAGGLQLDSCNYTDANATEQQCSPFLLAATVPEPGTAALLAFALAALARKRRPLC